MDMKMTDPELYGICERFTKHEVPDEPGQELCGETRYLAILAVLMGSGAPEAFEEVLGEALESGVSPAAVREAVYQATDYLGYGRMLTFLHRANGVFEKRGIKLPLQPQTTGGDRLERGIDAQARIFGEQMREAWKKSHINRWLAENCFGDFYTLTGLDVYKRQGRVRAAACGAYLRKFQCGQRRGSSETRCVAVPAVYRLSPQP